MSINELNQNEVYEVSGGMIRPGPAVYLYLFFTETDIGRYVAGLFTTKYNAEQLPVVEKVHPGSM